MKSVILAAGMGTRMKSKKIKVAHELAGRTVVEHVVRLSISVGARPIVVVGNQAELVKESLDGYEVSYANQAQQLGTGHAVLSAKEYFDDDDRLLVLYGDAPLLTKTSLEGLLKTHEEEGNAITVLTAQAENPHGYGRIIKDQDGNLEAIIEQKDANHEQAAIKEVNSGIYLFDLPKLKKHMDELKNDNQQGEYYLTDFIHIFKGHGYQVRAYQIADEAEILGINTRVQLHEAEEIMQERIRKHHMLNGVTMIDPKSCFIDDEVEIGQDTILYPGTILKGKTSIGEDCILGPRITVENCKVHQGVSIKESTLKDSEIGAMTTVGPYAYVRPGSIIGQRVKIGDFVEIKNSTIGDDTKISHLTYVGDGDVGEHVNLGCGVVFVNYDGHKKARTVVEDNVFVGCNTNLVSPVRIKQDAYIAAGSTITHEVPAGSLAIGRVRQEVKEGWVYNNNKKRVKK